MIKVVLSAQGIFKAGLYLYFILRIPLCLVFSQQAEGMTNQYSIILSDQMFILSGQRITCSVSISWVVRLGSHVVISFIILCGCCWSHPVVWSWWISLGIWMAAKRHLKPSRVYNALERLIDDCEENNSQRLKNSPEQIPRKEDLANYINQMGFSFFQNKLFT